MKGVSLDRRRGNTISLVKLSVTENFEIAIGRIFTSIILSIQHLIPFILHVECLDIYVE